VGGNLVGSASNMKTGPARPSHRGFKKKGKFQPATNVKERQQRKRKGGKGARRATIRGEIKGPVRKPMVENENGTEG